MTDYSPLATDDGFFTIFALDHRDALMVELQNEAGGSSASASGGASQPNPEDLRGFKRDMLGAFANLAELPSAVMLEPEFSLPDLTDAVPEGVGITCALEAQGYFADADAGNTLMDGWHPGRVTEVGANAAKLLVLYRHDRGEFTAAQERLVAEVVAGAAEANVPALIEPVPVDVVDDNDRREVILAAAERLNGIGPMILKLPYPGRGACAALTEKCGERPWALLSWGVPFEEFEEQLADAASGGASGFAVGRALWREAVAPAGRDEFNRTVLPARFADLVALARVGTPWTDAINR